MRIVSYNVHSCIGVDGRCAPERIAAVLAEIDADVACLQEVDMGRPRTGRLDQAAEIARMLTMQFHFHPAIQEVTGSYGDLILSKTPVRVVRADCLPEVPRPLPRERRGAIWMETTFGERRWQILNTHFGLGHGERRLQARALVDDWVRPALEQSPVILCGDFNSRAASSVHRILGEKLRDVFTLLERPHPRTFSTRCPFVCLDYVFLSPDVALRRALRWSSVLASCASDHFPLVAEVS